MFFIPEKIEQSLRYDGIEEVGYLFGLEYDPDFVIISKLITERGNIHVVSERDLKILNAVSSVSSEYEVVSYHTHPLERPSKGDLRQYYEMVKVEGVRFIAIGTPSRLLLYRASKLPNNNVLLKREKYTIRNLYPKGKRESIKLMKKLQQLTS